MAVDPKRTAPIPVAVTEDGTDTVVHTGDAANKAIRVNLVVGAGPSGGPSSAFNAPFPASGFGAGAKATAAAPTYAEGDMVPLSLDLTGNLRTAGGGGSGGGLSTFFRAIGSFSDLSTNLPLQRMQLTVYDTLVAVAASAQTFTAGTYLTVWGGRMRRRTWKS